MSLQKIRLEHIRGAILGLLMDGTWCNDAVLYDAILRVKHLTASRDQVRTALRWLGDQDLVTLEELPGDSLRVRITDQGRAFENGAIHVDGIHRRLKD